MGANAHWLGLERITLERGVGTIDKEHRAGWSQIASRTEGYRCVRPLGRSINPASLSSIERQLLSVHGEEIFAEKLAQLLK